MTGMHLISLSFLLHLRKYRIIERSGECGRSGGSRRLHLACKSLCQHNSQLFSVCAPFLNRFLFFSFNTLDKLLDSLLYLPFGQEGKKLVILPKAFVIAHYLRTIATLYCLYSPLIIFFVAILFLF